MLSKLLSLYRKYEDILLYLFFGVLTTLVNFLVYYPLYNLCEFSATVSNLIAWAAAVIFAFLTNKPFVFKSHDWSAAAVWPELTKFVACRIGSGLLETGAMFLFADLLGMNGNIWKIIVSVAVVVLNYVGSKLFVFRK